MPATLQSSRLPPAETPARQSFRGRAKADHDPPSQSATFADNLPQDHGTERYEHRHDWRRGLRGHSQISAFGGGTAAVRWAEYRALVSGTTSMMGSGSATGLARNLDLANALDGVNGPAWDRACFA